MHCGCASCRRPILLSRAFEVQSLLETGDQHTPIIWMKAIATPKSESQCT